MKIIPMQTVNGRAAFSVLQPNASFERMALENTLHA